MMASIFDASDIPAGIPLSLYTNAVTRAVASAPGLSDVWVIAELSDVRSAGGHCYMELIEKDESGQTVAKMRANIWRSNFIRLQQKFFNATQRNITSGIKALVRGGATHHSVYGLSFNIVDIDPSYTMGDMERLRREILMKLRQEGIALRNKNIAMPLAPQKIAVISAQGAAGYGDFIKHLCGNSEGFVFYPCLFPCVMQGDKVSESVRKALQMIEATADVWDCVAIVRGGGATTDMNGFDDYALAKAVATCCLPVVVGIGHDRDRNVLDDIAHTSLKTPTAVAGFFIDRAREAYDRVLAMTDRIRVYATELMRGEERRLSTIQTVVPQLALRRLDEHKALMQMLTGKLPLLTQGRIGNERVKLEGKINILDNLAGNIILRRIQKLDSIQSLLNVLDPKNTLRRGYSITRKNGKAVKTVTAISPGDILVTTLSDGEIQSSAV